MYPLPYLRQLFGSLFSRRRGSVKSSFLIPSEALRREVMVDVYRPAVPPWRLLSLAILSDGEQLDTPEAHRLFAACFRELSPRQGTRPVGKPALIVAVHTQAVTDGGAPSPADELPGYRDFLLDELVPFLERKFNIRQSAAFRAIAGVDAGAARALAIAWEVPQEFGVVGYFATATAPDRMPPALGPLRINKGKISALRYWLAGAGESTLPPEHFVFYLARALAEKGKEEGKDFVLVDAPASAEGSRKYYPQMIIDFLRWF